MVLCGKKRTTKSTKKASNAKSKAAAAKKASPKPRTTIKRAAKAKAVAKLPKAQDEDSTVVQKGNVTGGVMVDRFVPNSNLYTVHEANGTVYSTNLTYTRCLSNNNKFYIIQVLKKG